MNPTGESDNNHNDKENKNKYLIDDKYLRNFIEYYVDASLEPRKISVCIRSLNIERILRWLSNWTNFYSYRYFKEGTIVHSCEYFLAVLKQQGFQYKSNVRSVANFKPRNIKTMTFKETPEGTSGETRHLNKATTLIL